MGLRTQLELTFADLLPDTWRVVGNAKNQAVEQPGTVLFQFVPTTIKPLEQAPLGMRLHGFDFWVVVPGAEGSDANEDALEDAIEIALAVLDKHGYLTYEQAERLAYSDYPHAYKITAAIASERNS